MDDVLQAIFELAKASDIELDESMLDKDLDSLGVESLDVIRMIIELEEMFDVKLSHAMFYASDQTLRGLVSDIEQAINQSPGARS